MKQKGILFSEEINKLGLWIGETAPPRIGYWIARQISLIISRLKKTDQVRAVRLNQWVLSGKKLNGKELDAAVKNVYIESSRVLYDYYHYLRNSEAVKRMIVLDVGFQEFLAHSKAEIKGSLGLLLHMGGFDLAGYAVALHGMNPQIVSYPNPNKAYQWHNKLRKDQGLNVTPLSMEVLQQASRFLRNNGTVITGVDRPVEETRYYPRFFGQESYIPVTTIQLALRTKVPVVIIACIRQPAGHYILHASKFIEMESHPDRDVELVKNTERVLSVAESYILQAPQQWAMYYPVWPQYMSEVP